MNNVQPLTLRSRSGTQELLAYFPNEECTSTFYQRAEKHGMTVEFE